MLFPALLSTHRNVYLLYRVVIQSPCAKYNPQRFGNFNFSLLLFSFFFKSPIALFPTASWWSISPASFYQNFVINKRKARLRKTYGDILLHILFLSHYGLKVNIFSDSPAAGRLNTFPLAFPLLSIKFWYGSHFPASCFSYCNAYPKLYLTNPPPCFPKHRLRVHHYIKIPLPCSVISTSHNTDFLSYEPFNCVQLYQLKDIYICIYIYIHTSANEDNSFRDHIR